MTQVQDLTKTLKAKNALAWGFERHTRNPLNGHSPANRGTPCLCTVPSAYHGLREQWVTLRGACATHHGWTAGLGGRLEGTASGAPQERRVLEPVLGGHPLCTRCADDAGCCSCSCDSAKQAGAENKELIVTMEWFGVLLARNAPPASSGSGHTQHVHLCAKVHAVRAGRA